MSDRIFITGLALHAYHGVMPHEARVGQTFTIDLVLDIDLADAARSDKVVDTVSYDKVVECASEAFTAPDIPAGRGGRRQRRRRGARPLSRACVTIAVTIHKPHAPIAATFSDVGVTLERARGPAKP